MRTLFAFISGIVIVLFLGISPVHAQQKLWYKQPAEEWLEALPVGNGRLGAMVFGKVNYERIQLNEESVWTGQPVDRQQPEAGKYIPKVRDLLFNDKYEEAVKMLSEKVMTPAVSGHSYQTLGDLMLHFSHLGQVVDYRRELNLEEAIARVTYSKGGVNYTREVFSNPVNQSLVVHFAADQPGNISFSSKLTRAKDAQISASSEGLIRMMGQVTGGDAETQGQHPGVHYETQLKVENDGGTLEAAGDSLIVRGADTVTLYLTAATDYWGNDPHAVVLNVSERSLKSHTKKLSGNILPSTNGCIIGLQLISVILIKKMFPPTNGCKLCRMAARMWTW